MAAYVPNATQITEPTDNEKAATMGLEFRTLKTYIAALVAGTVPFAYVGDVPLLTQKLSTTAGYAGIKLTDQAGARRFELEILGSAAAALYGAAPGDTVLNLFTGNLILASTDLARYKFSAAGVLSTVEGAAFNELGYRSLPTASVTTGAPVLADRGKCVYATAGVTVPAAIFAQGDYFFIYNNTAAPITITQGIATLRLEGTATTGNRTLAARGFAEIRIVAVAEAVAIGPHVT